MAISQTFSTFGGREKESNNYNMKKLAYILLVSLLVSCHKEQSDDEYPKSHWGKPLTITIYEDAGGQRVDATTTYFYDQLNRLTGYKRVSSFGGMREEMLASVYSGKTHTYEIHSYEWVGVILPVVFFYTDTYTDSSFSTIEKRYMKAENAEWEETTTYRYENDRMTGYRTVVEGQRPKDFDTQITYYNDPSPSANSFPKEVKDEANRVEMVYTNKEGDRTGYYNDNDRHRAQWNFYYADGYCTYYISYLGNIDNPRLVRVVFYPENK